MNTDHKPLTYVMTSVTERPSLRQTRHLAFIAEFTTDIRYVKGVTNFVAEAMSDRLCQLYKVLQQLITKN